MGATEQIDRLIKVFRNDGLMWKAVDELGGDVSWLADTVVALAKAANALDEAYMSATAKDESVEEAGIGAPDYNPSASKWASNMEYGMFTPEGDTEVEEIVNDACVMVKRGTVDVMGAVDAAMRMLTDLAEMTDFEEAEDTDVRDRVAREIQSRCDNMEESAELNLLKKLAGI